MLSTRVGRLGAGVLAPWLLALASAAGAAQLQSLQTGTVVVTGGAGPVVVTLPTAVDTTKAFLVFGAAESTADPIDGHVSGQLTSSTTVTFLQNGGSASVTVKYYVAEFATGVSVQRGSVANASGNVFNVALGTAVDTAKSFPLISFRSDGVNFNCNDFVRAKITSATNLQLSADVTCGAVANSTVEWQVVEYQDANVRTGDVAFAAAATAQTVTLTPAVNTGKSWLIYSYETSPTSIPDIGQSLVRGQVTNSTTLTFDRGNSGAVGLTASWYLVEFTDASFVQSGSQAFSTADTAINVTLPRAAPLANSIALGGGEDQHGGSSTYAANDVIGVGWFNYDLTALRTLRITRGAGGLGPANAGWSVITFPVAPATAVELASFEARGVPSAVELAWQTGSELDNLGFHLHRAPSETGPWTRITSALLPGLGSSPMGASYTWTDADVVAGQRYYYELEDVDTQAVSTFHGPVSAVPLAPGAPASPAPDEPIPPAASADTAPGSTRAAPGRCPAWVWTAYAERAAVGEEPAECTRQGDPEAVSVSVRRSALEATVDLRTGGFYAVRGSGGAVRAFVPGFDFPSGATTAALPLRRVLVDAIVGRGARVASVEARDWASYPGLVPAAVGRSEMAVGRDGTVRPKHRAPDPAALGAGMRVAPAARLAGVSFLAEAKAVALELSPLRFDPARSSLRLARRLVVRLAFSGAEPGESGRGCRGRRPRHDHRGGRPGDGPPTSGEVLAHLFTTARGLHAVAFESLFPGGRRAIATSSLRLQRAGQPVGFRVEPSRPYFGRGSVLYFFAPDAAASTDYAGEIAYELVTGTGGVAMAPLAAAPTGPAVALPPDGFASFETNRLYAPGLLDAADPWQWDAVSAGEARTEPFVLGKVDASAPGAILAYLQGGSDSGNGADHHLRLSVNGVPVGDTTFAGRVPQTLATAVPAGLLREGGNELTVTNVGDTGVASLVFLDRFDVEYPHAAAASGGRFEGRWSPGGAATVAVEGVPAVVDVTAAPRWLTGLATTGGTVSFRVEAGHRYVVAAGEGLIAPRVAAPVPTTLRETNNQADYVLIAPQAFVEAAQPLVERRAAQGLAVKVATLEEIASAFGGGSPSAAAIHAFLEHAYQSWRRPSPRYVLLLGGASQDPRNFTGTSRLSPLPYVLERTSFLWTGSDPALAAVNGDDAVPDLALGRLPAHTQAQAQALVAKVLDWEDTGQSVDGRAVLVADNPDAGGDFDADVDDVAARYLAGRETEVVKLSKLGGATRGAVLDAWNGGSSLMSYVGHGAAATWASEGLLTSFDVASLLAQPRQPVLLTLNCLNGYFLAPSYDPLAEALVKAAGKGAIASVSPSGLSLDAPAHEYHRALMKELTGGAHTRLGDAFLAAQLDYARSGQMPELLGVYNLFGDPAMPLR